MVASSAPSGSTCEFQETEVNCGVSPVQRIRLVRKQPSCDRAPSPEAGVADEAEMIGVVDEFGHDPEIQAPIMIFEHRGRWANQCFGKRSKRRLRLLRERLEECISPCCHKFLVWFEHGCQQRFAIAEVVLNRIGVALVGISGDLTQRCGVDALVRKELAG